MSWCERHRIGYILGLAGDKVLLKAAAGLAEEAALGRIADEGEKVRRYGEFRYAAGTWDVERRGHHRSSGIPVFPGEVAAIGREPLVVDLGEDIRQRRARRRRCHAQGQGRGA